MTGGTFGDLEPINRSRKADIRDLGIFGNVDKGPTIKMRVFQNLEPFTLCETTGFGPLPRKVPGLKSRSLTKSLLSFYCGIL